MDDDSDKTITSSSSDSEDEDLQLDESKVLSLEEKIISNPYDYASHVELLKYLNSGGDIDRCREVRERMSGIFPLTPEMWIQWINQEKLLLPINREKIQASVEKLYERAVQDYQSVRLWHQYCNDAIQVLEYDTERIREIFEKALTSAGLHVTSGSWLWDQYRQYETSLLDLIDEKLKTDKNDEILKTKRRKQDEIVNNLYTRQLSVPLKGMDITYREYIDWAGSESIISSTVKEKFESAKKKLEVLLEFEEQIENSPSPHRAAYQSYIDFERKENNPSRVMCTMERAIADNPLDCGLWCSYLEYLDQVVRHGEVVLSVYARAVRNIPWTVEVWCSYLLALQRHGKHFTHVESTMEEALKNGFGDATSYVTLYACYLDFHWRQERSVTHENGDKPKVNALDRAFEDAINFINQQFGEGADSHGQLTMFMAEVDGIRGDVDSMRNLLSDLLLLPVYKEQSRIWMYYIELEQRYGTKDSVRNVFRKAIYCNTDACDYILNQFLLFERLHGTLETYDNAYLKVKRVQKRNAEKISKENDRRRNEAIPDGKKERKFEAKKRKLSDDSKVKGKPKKPKRLKDGTSSKKDTSVSQNLGVPFSAASSSKPKQHSSEEVTIDKSKYNVTSSKPKQHSSEEVTIDKSKYNVASSKPKQHSSEEVTIDKSKYNVTSSKPKQHSSEEVTIDKSKYNVASSKPKQHSSEEVTIDKSKYNVTVFVSNLSYDANEDHLNEVFKNVGDIVDIRLVKSVNGKSRGFGYIEFHTREEVMSALELDRVSILGRPCYVSECKDKVRGTAADFKFKTCIEAHKLYISNLPYKTTEDELRKIFSEVGEVKSIRMVTTKGGKFKGFSYIEYLSEEAAKNAVIKLNGLEIQGRAIQVAISNPPKKASATPKLNATPKTSSFLVPRSVAKPAISLKDNPSSNKEKEVYSKPAMLSNSDFRKFLTK